jgi:stress response protein YsnF
MTSGTADPSGSVPSDGPDGSVAESAVRTGRDVSVVRSEERVQFSVETVPVERVKLVKVVVSREETITVTVRREEFRLVREPVVAGEVVPSNTVSTPIELVLHEEQIVVERRVVPVERVRVSVDRVLDEVAVTTTLKHEHIDIAHDDGVEPPSGC